MSRKVTVYSPAGRNANQFEVEGRTWKELQKTLSSNGVNYSGMKAVIGENKLTMESDNAMLPDGNFTLFLMPIKTKSGADRKQLMADIKNFVTANPSRKQDFIIDGKNMTQLSTQTLEQLVAKHIPTKSGGSTPAPAPAPVVDKIAESAKKAANSVKKAVAENTEAEVDYPALIAAKKAEVAAAIAANNYAVLSTLGAEVTSLEIAKNEQEKQKSIKAAAEKEANEKAEKEAKEAAKQSEKAGKDKLVADLDKQARELARDFKDLKSF